MEKIFEKKVVIITGGSSGIGQATAVAFAERGATVVIGDCSDSAETLDLIKNKGSEGMYIKCDVSKDADVKALIEETVKAYGSLDYAFNNAGIEGVMTPVQEVTEESWDKTINVNLKGIWLCMKYEIPQMLKQGKGAIVNCSSIAGLIGFSTAAAYVASKHGIIGLTKTAALENAKSGIRVNAVCPGVIDTPMIDRATKGNLEVKQQYASAEPVGRLGQPMEIAEAVIWLCSEASSFVTGHALAVDGGWVAQ